MGFGRNVTIRSKLASLVALNVLLLAVIGFYSIRQIRCVRREIDEITEQDIPLTKALSDLAEHQEEMDASLERVLRLEGLKGTDARAAALAAARAELARLRGREAEDLRDGGQVARRALAAAETPEDKADFSRVTAALDRVAREYGDYDREVARVLALIDARKLDEAEAALPRVEREEADLDQAVAALVADVEGFTAASAHHVEMHEHQVITHVTVAGVAGVIAGLVLGAFYGRGITRRLATAVGVADRLAAGERRFDIPADGRDEPAALLRAMSRMAAEITRGEDALRAEHDRSEGLLLNILPRAIADRLKLNQQAIADGFAEVTVLFADVVGFTALSARVPPAELVQVLNGVFSTFDRLAEKHGLEKIKTIGDCYMAVGGLPVPRPDHARAVAELALDMQEALGRFDDAAAGVDPFRVRIGINSGPVVAGVIGIRKFIYDLWGDTVNVASRMESHGLPGEIQVSDATYELLKDHYVFEQRGEIEVKGKGRMTTYLLKGRKANTRQPAAKPAAGAAG